jgi:uncharacterized membrane protein
MQLRGSAAAGFGVGMALMYLLDPQRGRRRRALMRDRVAHATRISRDAVGATSRDVMHRTYGTAAQLGRGLTGRSVDDDVLVARVRSKLGRVVSHPHSVQVQAARGTVTLRGPILQHEIPQLLQTVRSVRGVQDVVNELEEHKEAENVPGLQGGATPPGIHVDLLQDRWSPATRLLAGAGGASLIGYGASRRNTAAGMLVALGGVGLLARAASNLDAGQLTGLSPRRRAIDIQKTITVDAPVEAVFEFWTGYQNFPRFMSRVLDVRPSTRAGQSHWTVAGPAGLPVAFDAEETRIIPNQVFGWRTLSGSPVGHAGIIHFEPTSDGGTRIHIRMSYNPLGGWLGHGIATAFGADPKTSMDADLTRMKTLIETGRAPRDAARPEHS